MTTPPVLLGRGSSVLVYRGSALCAPIALIIYPIARESRQPYQAYCLSGFANQFCEPFLPMVVMVASSAYRDKVVECVGSLKSKPFISFFCMVRHDCPLSTDARNTKSAFGEFS